MYSQELIDEIKAVYPDNAYIGEAAEQGKTALGDMILNAMPGPKDTKDLIADVLAVTTIRPTMADMINLKEKAQKLDRRFNLYKLWLKEDPRPEKLLS